MFCRRPLAVLAFGVFILSSPAAVAALWTFAHTVRSIRCGTDHPRASLPRWIYVSRRPTQVDPQTICPYVFGQADPTQSDSRGKRNLFA